MSIKLLKQITRIGVYGAAINQGKMLVVRQQRGPFSDKLDFPGGGIEFGESPEKALRREFLEEVAMGFEAMQLLANLTATTAVPRTSSSEAYSFFQIGMIYQVTNLRSIKELAKAQLDYEWINPTCLCQEKSSPLLWTFLKNYKEFL